MQLGMIGRRQGVVLQDVMHIVDGGMECRDVSLVGVDSEVKRDGLWIAMIAGHIRASYELREMR